MTNDRIAVVVRTRAEVAAMVEDVATAAGIPAEHVAATMLAFGARFLSGPPPERETEPVRGFSTARRMAAVETLQALGWKWDGTALQWMPPPETGADTARLDYIERTFSGMTNRERYLPVRMIWGTGANGRTLREACDKYMARDARTAPHEGQGLQDDHGGATA